MKRVAMFCLVLSLGATSAMAMPSPFSALAGTVQIAPHLRAMPMLLAEVPIEPAFQLRLRRPLRQRIQMK